MTPKEYIKQEYGESWLNHEWSAGDVIDTLEEYGKYCTEQAWKEAITTFHVITFKHDEWWSERRQRNTEITKS